MFYRVIAEELYHEEWREDSNKIYDINHGGNYIELLRLISKLLRDNLRVTVYADSPEKGEHVHELLPSA